jgi:hypothetical protein
VAVGWGAAVGVGVAVGFGVGVGVAAGPQATASNKAAIATSRNALGREADRHFIERLLIQALHSR